MAEAIGSLSAKDMQELIDYYAAEMAKPQPDDMIGKIYNAVYPKANADPTFSSLRAFDPFDPVAADPYLKLDFSGLSGPKSWQYFDNGTTGYKGTGAYLGYMPSGGLINQKWADYLVANGVVDANGNPVRTFSQTGTFYLDPDKIAAADKLLTPVERQKDSGLGGLGGLLGLGLGIVTGNPVIGGMFAGGLSSGSMGGVIKGGITSALGQSVASLNPGGVNYVQPMSEQLGAQAINKGVASAVSSGASGLMSGKSLADSLKSGLTSGISSGAGSYVGGNLSNILDKSGVNRDAAGFLSGTAGGTVAGMLSGQGARDALTGAAVGSAASTLGSMAGRYANTGNATLDKMISSLVKGGISNYAKAALAPSPRTPAKPQFSPLPSATAIPQVPSVSRGMITQEPTGAFSRGTTPSLANGASVRSSNVGFQNINRPDEIRQWYIRQYGNIPVPGMSV